MRVVRYIKSSPGQGLFYPVQSNLSLSIFCDADWGSCVFTRQSLSAFCVRLGASMINWKVKKEDVVSKSTAEAEYRSLSRAVAEALWMKGLLSELGVKDAAGAIPIFSDSEAAIQISKNPMFHERTKHIDIDCYFIRSKVVDGTILPSFVSSENQLADLLTKALSREAHEFLMNQYGVKDIFRKDKETQQSKEDMNEEKRKRRKDEGEY